MVIVFLRFSNHKTKAGELMTAHNEWIKRGFDDGVFLLGRIRSQVQSRRLIGQPKA